MLHDAFLEVHPEGRFVRSALLSISCFQTQFLPPGLPCMHFRDEANGKKKRNPDWAVVTPILGTGNLYRQCLQLIQPFQPRHDCINHCCLPLEHVHGVVDLGLLDFRRHTPMKNSWVWRRLDVAAAFLGQWRICFLRLL